MRELDRLSTLLSLKEKRVGELEKDIQSLSLSLEHKLALCMVEYKSIEKIEQKVIEYRDKKK